MLLRQIDQRAARVGDGDKVRPDLGAAQGQARLGITMLEERARLYRAAGLGGDDVERTRRIQVLRFRPDGIGVRAVQHRQRQSAGLLTPKRAEKLRRKAGAAHTKQQHVGVAISAHIVHQAADAADTAPGTTQIQVSADRVRHIRSVGRQHVLRAIQPAEAIGDFRRVGPPHCVIATPDAPHDVGRGHLDQGFVHKALVTVQTRRNVLRLRADVVAPRGDGAQQGLERGDEFVDAFGLQFLARHVQVNAQFCQTRDARPAPLHVIFNRQGDRAVVEEGVERLGRQRVDRVGADERIHVERVRQRGVLGAGAGPQRPLHARALRRQPLPAFAGEELAEALIDQFGVVNGDSRLQLRRAGFGQRGVQLDVDATDEEGGH